MTERAFFEAPGRAGLLIMKRLTQKVVMVRSTAGASLSAIAVTVLLLLLCLPALAQSADPPFPPLTGRVVDVANILKPDERASLEAKLKADEDRTSDQLVVAIVPSLGGLEIEDYANRLFRAWKLGQAKTNNGVLLLVATGERKVRIEVGYGLEGTLTDAISSVIVRSAIAPKFRAGDYAGGITAGIDAVIGTLTGDTAEWQDRARQRPKPAQQTGIDPLLALFIFVLIVIVVIRFLRGGGGPPGGRSHRTFGGGWIPIPTSGGFGGGGFGGGGFGGGGGGGFSGGGGSSGGGGASGSW